MLTGWFPSFMILPTPPPKGSVNTLPLLARQLNLQPHAPRGSSLRVHCIAVQLSQDVNWLVSQLHDSSHAATEGQRQYVAAACPPVGGDNRRRGEIPALLHVVVDEPLQQHLVDWGTAPRTRNRPDVIDQGANDPFPRRGQQNDSRPHAELSLAKLIGGSRGENEGWPDTPNQFARLRWREEERGIHVAESKPALRSLTDVRLPDDWLNDASNQVPVLADANRNDGLDIQYVLSAVIRSNSKSRVVLERNADK